MRPTESPAVARSIDSAAESGRGRVAVEQIAGDSFVTRLRANSPLKLLSPHRRSHAAWVIAGSYGGGLVAGDHLRLDVRVGTGASLFIGTQASTKIYRSIDGRSCGQELAVDAGAGAMCVIAPDPVTPFSGAIYDQRQRIDLAAGASLVLVDWLTAGRCATGERWAFSRYASRTNVFLAGRPVFRDALRLDASDGSLASVCRTGGFDCFATAVLIGEAVAAHAAALLQTLERAPLRRGGPILFAASPLASGLVLRAAGTGPEVVGRWLREQLSLVAGLLGEDPWARKW